MAVSELLEALTRLETELHLSETRRDPQRMRELLHEDFEEFGRSGRSYSRREVLAEFSAEQTLPRIAASDFAVHRLGDDLALLTYRTAHVGVSGELSRHTLRSSLWTLTATGWRMRFHQGTPTDAPV